MTSLWIAGNQLGEGADEIKEEMDSLGKGDVLAPFEENEEPDSDDQDGDDEDEDEEEEEGEHDASKGTGDDLALEIKGLGFSPDSKQLQDRNSQLEAKVRKIFITSFYFT